MTTCIRCKGALDQWGEHLVPCKQSTNPEFRRVDPTLRSQAEALVRTNARRRSRFEIARIPEMKDRFEAVREAA